MMERKQTLETACRDFEEDLVLYYYGDGSERERSRVEVHMRTCARCQRFLDDLRRLLPQMAQPESLPQRPSRRSRRSGNGVLGGEIFQRRCGPGPCPFLPPQASRCWRSGCSSAGAVGIPRRSDRGRTSLRRF
ncbi:MAG: zf-HC2 domain-containing protein [Deltaproteobacteria bacterium]|nr:zf-HC2 domain-containing protein [Deltaproteobacteria bacterium]